MYAYSINLFYYIINNLIIIYHLIFPKIIIKYVYILKIIFVNELINSIFEFNFFFFLIYLFWIVILSHYSYKYFYLQVIKFFDLKIVNIMKKKFLIFKSFILNNNFEKLFIENYIKLFYFNIKQFLIGTGFIIFFILLYYIFIIYSDYFFHNFTNTNSQIYIIGYKQLNLNYQFYNLNFFFLYIIIYIFLHSLLGLYNIYFDYLKDFAFVLLFLSFFLCFLLVNLVLIQYNIEIYTFIFNINTSQIIK